MKSCTLPILFFVSILLVLKVYSEDDNIYNIVISPKVKHFASNGNDEVPTKDEHSRFIRAPNGCKIPSSLENSELKCKIYPSKVECNQTCVFGHTFPEGIQRQMKCKYEEDKWYPSREFDNCKPFVDCNLAYGPGAYAKCYTNHMHKGPSCDVRCEHYEDKLPVPMAKYQCDIEGKWSPKLPFCVKPGSGDKLVSAPRGRKLHKRMILKQAALDYYGDE